MTTQEDLCHICKKSMKAFPMGEKNGFSFSACQACGSVMVMPWITQQQREQVLGEIQPEATHVPNPEAEIAFYKKRLQKATGSISGTGRRFLDVGCRQGYAVMAAKETGYQAKGLDQHDFFIRFAQDKYGNELFESATAQNYADSKQQAEVIFALECFSEQTDPDAFTAALAKILAPGGLLYIEEPDGNSFHLPRSFENWSFAEPPFNFVYPSKKGLTALLKRHGLKITRSFFSWSPMMKLIVTKA